jgi:peptide/nickel transport system substrate-binding protein
MRRDYTVGLTVTETALDDPDQLFYENCACGAERNYTGYCNPQLDQLIDRQSMEAVEDKRRALVRTLPSFGCKALNSLAAGGVGLSTR